MIQNYNTYKILKLFFDFPRKKFQLRELSRKTNVGLPSVINHVKKLEKEGFVKRVSEGVYDSYVSNRNEKFKSYRKNDVLLRLKESGLVDFLADEFIPDTIVLFGSASMGEDVEESDIDLCIIAENVDNPFLSTLRIAPKVIGIDLRIEPLVFSLKDYEENSNFGILKEIKEKGIEI